MAKLHGTKKWNHPLPVWAEIWALERELDSLSQRGYPVSKQLGRVRSIIRRWKHGDFEKQKTLKRWTKPAPNQMVAN